MDSEYIRSVIEKANEKAKEVGVTGKKLTPFLLKEIAVATQGQSVESNIALVKNNARAAAEIAKELSQLVCKEK